MTIKFPGNEFFGRLINQENKCSGNSNFFTQWSDIGTVIPQNYFDSSEIKWSDNQQVYLLKDSAMFNLRQKLVSGEKVSPYTDGIGNNSVRSSENPFVWSWMWGVYDDAIGEAYTDLHLTEKNAHLIMDMNVMEHHGHEGTGNKLAPYGQKSFVNGKFQFQATNGVLLGAKYTNEHFGFGMHKKGMIIDGRYFLMGGRNFGLYYSKYWRDTDILIVGKAANEAANLYLKDSVRHGHSDLAFNSESNSTFYAASESKGEESVAIVDNNPADNGQQDRILALYVDLIKNKAEAGSDIYMEHAYFIITDPIREAFKVALQKGINIHLHTNSPISIDEPIISTPAMVSVRELLEMGQNYGPGKVYVKLRNTRYIETKDQDTDFANSTLANSQILASVTPRAENLSTALPSTLHSKYLLVQTGVDQYVTLVGSYNMHPRSLRYEDEIVSLIKGGGEAGSTHAQFVEWFNESDQLEAASSLNAPLKNLQNPNAILLLPADQTLSSEITEEQKITKSVIDGTLSIVMTLAFDQL